MEPWEDLRVSPFRDTEQCMLEFLIEAVLFWLPFFVRLIADIFIVHYPEEQMVTLNRLLFFSFVDHLANQKGPEKTGFLVHVNQLLIRYRDENSVIFLKLKYSSLIDGIESIF